VQGSESQSQKKKRKTPQLNDAAWEIFKRQTN
jgi:hypothetical protein